jgi:hypothetical protein
MKAQFFQPFGVIEANGDKMPVVNTQSILKGAVVIR